jgi:hypothetical protein
LEPKREVEAGAAEGAPKREGVVVLEAGAEGALEAKEGPPTSVSLTSTIQTRAWEELPEQAACRSSSSRGAKETSRRGRSGRRGRTKETSSRRSGLGSTSEQTTWRGSYRSGRSCCRSAEGEGRLGGSGWEAAGERSAGDHLARRPERVDAQVAGAAPKIELGAAAGVELEGLAAVVRSREIDVSDGLMSVMG